MFPGGAWNSQMDNRIRADVMKFWAPGKNSRKVAGGGPRKTRPTPPARDVTVRRRERVRWRTIALD